MENNHVGKNLATLTSDIFFIKDHIKSGDINSQYCPTEIILADFFTKPLQGKQFKLLRSAVMGWISLDQLKSSLTEKSKGAC